MRIAQKQFLSLFAGVLTTCCAILAVWKLNVPNPNVVLISVVVFFTFWGGFLCGIPSGIITILYSCYFFLIKNPGTVSEQKVCVIALFIPLIIFMVGMLKYKEQQKSRELARVNEKLEHLVNLDPLTRIPNRRFLDSILDSTESEAEQESIPVSFVMIDIDFFKEYNDTYGHLKGDEALKKLASVITEQVQRSGDYAARYGGDEFSLVLSNTTVNGAALVCERIRKSVWECNIRHRESAVADRLTVSCGISCTFQNTTEDYKQLILRADKALYHAKENGRNRIFVEQPVS